MAKEEEKHPVDEDIEGIDDDTTLECTEDYDDYYTSPELMKRLLTKMSGHEGCYRNRL